MEVWLSLSIIIMSIISLVTVPVIIIYLPSDYFIGKKRGDVYYFNLHPILHYTLVVAKNLVGIVLLGLGAILLVLPGQGLLTILIGFLMIDFPGKYKVIRTLVNKKPVYKPINWLRKKFNRGPIILESNS